MKLIPEILLVLGLSLVTFAMHGYFGIPGASLFLGGAFLVLSFLLAISRR